MAVNNQVLQKMVAQANQAQTKSSAGPIMTAVLLTAIIIGGGVWAYDNFMVIKVKDQSLTEVTNKLTELDNQNKNLAQQLNDLNKAKEEEAKLKARTIDLPDYNATVIIPESDTFLVDNNWSNVPGLYNFKIQDSNFSQNNVPYLLAYTLDAIKKQEDSCKISGCSEYLDTVKQFTEERGLWENDQNSIASDAKLVYEIKTFNDTKYAVVNRKAVGDSGYIRTYFTFLDNNTKLVMKIFIPDEATTQAADAFMSNVNLVIN